MVKVQVKWQGKKFDVDVDLTQPGEVFKMQLYSLTNVAPERQRILVKGGQLKDNTVMSTLGLKENSVLMMMGTVGELPKAPVEQTKFVEDMTDNEVAQALAIPAGLTNLGNTCYMNATLQCLKAVPELKQALDAYEGAAPETSAADNSKRSLVLSLRSLFTQLNESGEGVPPMVFLHVLRQLFPKFAEQDRQSGGFRQQDAEECWNELLTTLDLALQPSDGAAPSVVERYMSGQMQTTWSTAEAPSEPPTVHHERFRKLDCHIDKSVNYLSQGVAKGLEQKIEKHSESLGRNAEYTAVSRVARLPEYLTVAYNRFFWKASESVEAKIVKSVKFPLDLDVSEFCTPELQRKMRPVKQHVRDLEDRRAAERKAAAKRPRIDGSNDDAQASTSASSEQQTEEAAAPFVLDPELKADVGCNPSGLYELVGLVTHIGRTANSGHYIGWVRKEKGVGGKEPEGKGVPETRHWWYKFDDDDVSMVTDEEILRLCGGGDWHTAYVTLYRAKKLD
ncbi:deubiquitinating enzyme [Coemansia erecta]|uniref:Ubiquitin carboxyl-terminal hydrolase n=1 Tax=Coemansia erecta TaxID=147472 RepID=A0A9W7XWU0_9FUNG|nr:deubiquitinating enzyme [Coemansia erecta]